MVFGRKLGEGRTAEVYEFGEGRVIKVLRPGFPPRMLEEERAMTALAAAAGAPAPGVHGLEVHEGREGLVMDAAPGVSLLDSIMSDLDRWGEWAAVMARAHAAILKLRADDALDVKERLRSAIASVMELSHRHRQEVLEVLDSLQDRHSLLHGDFHPRNIFVDGDQVMVIDWGNASRGSAAADIARTLHLVSPTALSPDFPGREHIMRLLDGFTDRYLRTVLELTGVSETDVDRWVLPVLAGRLSERNEWERATLLEEIERRSG